MLNEISAKTRRLVLKKFTEELIRNYNPIYIYKLKQKLIEEEEKKKPKITSPIKIIRPISKEEIKQKIKKRANTERKRDIIEELKSPISKSVPFTKEIIIKYPTGTTPPTQNQFEFQRSSQKRVLRIPETNLPERLRYLKPSPTYTEINLGKLMPLINDINVDSIECPGPNQKILVEGKMGKKPTGIILNQEEINQIVNEFSSKSKIPIGEGISKVAVGKLTFTAIKTESEVTFIIKKMKMAPFQRGVPSPIY